ncbi:hypothetical protein AB1Y20_000776 [Prymnesium parvum]|uniref:Amine oxidase n=1 Tax=Prymnesium parvum TaxID=97485 RepID=A0AB34K6E0_PRYPA
MAALHALSPLTPPELAEAVAAFCRAYRARGAPGELVFFDVSLLERASSADKRAALENGEWQPLLPRRAAVIAGDPAARLVLVGDAPTQPPSASPAPASLRVEPLVQPPWPAEEYAIAEKLVLEYPPLREACIARGIDPAHVRVDPWCVGWHGKEDDPTRRLGTPMLFVQEKPEDALYCRPLEGIRMRFDLWSTPPAVVEFRDLGPTSAPPIPPLPPGSLFPDPEAEARRPPLRPLRAVQPEGVSFTLGADSQLAWQRWEAVVGFSAREGAFLHAVKYDGRPVAWRLSFCEMVVPYGDPAHPHYQKAAFDAGEDGLGRNTNSLQPQGCDCAPGASAAFLDATLAARDGSANVISNAVCVHEEDGGLLWKHTDWRTGEAHARRNRKLVVMFVCTIANYTYAFSYKLGLDGAIEMEATLTGILSMGALHEHEKSRPWGQTLSTDGLYAPDHQHFFVARLDMAVDGVDNRVVEVESELAGSVGDAWDLAAAADPHGSVAVRRRKSVLQSELHARRTGLPQKGRHWLVENSTRRNVVGERTAWRLEPGAGSSLLPLCDTSAKYLLRASFLQHNLWVTAYSAAERYPGGDFPNQRGPDRPDGLELWTSNDRPIVDTDVVLWHVFGVQHAVRLEDFPVMPCEHVGFVLKPNGFFGYSPCVDVPCVACDGARSKL